MLRLGRPERDQRGEEARAGMDRLAIKTSVQLAFENVLRALDQIDREPDRLEQSALVDALCSMAGGQYVQAAERIFTVSRSLKKKPMGGEEAERRVTKDMMRRGLMHVRLYR